MALVKGTNCGFVTVAPTADPTGTNTRVDSFAYAEKDTSPIGAIKIVEIGWWCDTATQEANFEVGLYSHNAGGDKPNARLNVSNTNAKGTTAGWKSVAVDWTISAETIYWLAAQLDVTGAGATNINYTISASPDRLSYNPETTLPATWAAGSAQFAYNVSIYAVYETATYVNISGTIAGTSSLSGILAVSTVIDVSGTISGTSSLAGILTLETIIDILGTIPGTSTLTGAIILSSDWQIGSEIPTKRLIQIGNNALWYEDI